MPLFEENPNQKTNNQQANAEQQTQTQPNPNQSDSKSSGFMTAIGSLLPFAPLVFEQFTGQKVPQMSGTMAEIQLALSNILVAQQTILINQQQLTQRINNLENNAVQQLTSLTQQFQSLRLTHTREKKEIEYNPSPKLDNQEY